MAESVHSELETFDFLENMPQQDLEDLLAAIRNGAEFAADAFGFNDAALNRLEDIALAYYRGRKYEHAAAIFGFVLQLKPTRSSAWRGLGASAQALKNYNVAAQSYASALLNDHADVISKVLLGELLCMQGHRDGGVGLLREAVASETSDQVQKAYQLRAQAVLDADGGQPPKFILRQKSAAMVDEAQALGAEQPDGPHTEDEDFQFDPERELTWEDAKSHPKLRAAIEQITEHIANGNLTYAEVAGFTDAQMDGMHKLIASYIDTNRLPDALQLVGIVLFLDPNSARFHTLAGIIYHRMKQWVPANFHYEMAILNNPEDPEPIVFHGEVLLLEGRLDEGRKELERGLQLAESQNNGDVGERARVLLNTCSRPDG